MGSPSLAGRLGRGAGDNCGIPSPQGRLVALLAAPDPPFMALINEFIPCHERSPALQMSLPDIQEGFFFPWLFFGKPVIGIIISWCPQVNEMLDETAHLCSSKGLETPQIQSAQEQFGSIYINPALFPRPSRSHSLPMFQGAQREFQTLQIPCGSIPPSQNPWICSGFCPASILAAG